MATVGVPAAEAHSVAAFAGDHAREAQSDSARSLEEEREKHRQRCVSGLRDNVAAAWL